MTQDEKKKAVAEAALAYVESGWVIGVGSGSTANYFIDALARLKGKIDGTVASSNASAERLKKHGIPVLDLNATGDLPLYVDGADETTRHLHLIKGGGGRINDRVITDELHPVTSAAVTELGVIRVSAGKKRHALVRPV